jgi:hypothetical protein
MEQVLEAKSKMEQRPSNFDPSRAPSCKAMTHSPREAIAAMTQFPMQEPLSSEWKGYESLRA